MTDDQEVERGKLVSMLLTEIEMSKRGRLQLEEQFRDLESRQEHRINRLLEENERRLDRLHADAQRDWLHERSWPVRFGRAVLSVVLAGSVAAGSLGYHETDERIDGVTARIEQVAEDNEENQALILGVAAGSRHHEHREHDPHPHKEEACRCTSGDGKSMECWPGTACANGGRELCQSSLPGWNCEIPE